MTEPYGFDDATDDGDDEGQQERYVRLERNQIRALERDAKAARKTADENAQLKRDLAFAKAGVELTERQQKALSATIDGDLTAEAIRTAAEELGFVAAPAAASTTDEAAALERIATASPGTAESPDDDPIARLDRAAEEGGYDAVLAQIQRDGHNIVTSG